MANEMLQAALSYARLGFQVFPLKPRGKKPLTEHGFKDATTDTALIRKWWERYPNANIGIYCRGLLVLDFDGQVGFQGKCVLEKERQPLPDTWVVKTGGGTEVEPKEQGGQYIYRVPPETEIRPGAGKYGYQNLDVRAGESYICAVPSVTRLPYETIAGSPDAVAPAPQWLIEFVLNGSRPSSQRRTQGEPIKETTRNATLTSIGGAMRRQGAEQGAIEVALLEINRRQCQPPLDDSEVLAIAKSVSRYEPEPFTTQEIESPALGLPAIAWQGLFKDYRDLVADTTEAADAFHYATFCQVLGCTIGRRLAVYHATKLYPNFNI